MKVEGVIAVVDKFNTEAGRKPKDRLAGLRLIAEHTIVLINQLQPLVEPNPLEGDFESLK